MDAPRSVRSILKRPLGFAAFSAIIVWCAVGVVVSALIGNIVARLLLMTTVTPAHSFRDEWAQNGGLAWAACSLVCFIILVVIGVLVGLAWTKTGYRNSLPDWNQEYLDDAHLLERPRTTLD